MKVDDDKSVESDVSSTHGKKDNQKRACANHLPPPEQSQPQINRTLDIASTSMSSFGCPMSSIDMSNKDISVTPSMNTGTSYGENSSTAAFRETVVKLRLPNGMENKPYEAVLDFAPILKNYDAISLNDAGIKETDSGLEISLANNIVHVSGTPSIHGTLTIWLEYHISNNNGYSVNLSEHIQPLMILPDPKSLWKNLDTDAEAPFQSPNEDALEISEINGKILVGASKRGRSHAHEGKFRDDCFKARWLPENGWLIVAVSDGAGSAEYSRKGADIACSVFIEELSKKLSDKNTNQKIDAIYDERKQELALEHLLISIAHKAALAINEFALSAELPTKKFSATFLGYIIRQIGGKWLITTVGIGDGAIALIDRENQLHLLNTPDGGEYVGQTRFLTTPDVWRGLTKPEAWTELQNRAKSARVNDFRFVFSMTDGVSDPMFETDNNLCSAEKWLDFVNSLTRTSENPIHLDRDNPAIADELLKWLDFWSKGNYDDRTLTILF